MESALGRKHKCQYNSCVEQAKLRDVAIKQLYINTLYLISLWGFFLVPGRPHDISPDS